METQEVLRVIFTLIPPSFCQREPEIQIQLHMSGSFPLGRRDKRESMYAEHAIKAYFHRNFIGTV